MANLPLHLVKNFYYKKELSVQKVAKKLKVTPKTVRIFMIKNNLSRRSFKEANAIVFKRKPITFSIKKNLSEKEKKLKVAGIMLYWAEGLKATKRYFVIDFSNSDPKMIQVFLQFLRRVCGVDERRLRVLLYCYSNQDVDGILKYWQRITKIPLRQFTKPYIRKDFQEKKRGKMEHGLVHIRYADKKLFLQIQNWLQEYLKNNKINGQVRK